MTTNWTGLIDPSDLKKKLKYLAQGTELSNKELISQIQNLHLDIGNPSSVIEMTFSLCQLITRQSYIFNINLLGPSHWRNHLLQKKFSNGFMIRALMERDELNYHILMLYEDDFGSTRETIHYLDDQIPPHNIPYLRVILRNALIHLFNYHEKEDRLDLITELFQTDKKLLNWCEKIKSQGLPLKQFAGQTNTQVGFYHQKLSKAPEVKNLLLNPSDINIDLGGGFATPEISQLFQQKFISYDILSPEKAIDWDIFLEKDPHIQHFDFDLDEFKKKLQNQEFQKFDIFQDDFPTHYQKYNIVSFGFVSSTVRSLSENQPSFHKRWRYMGTTFYAVLRVVILAAQNKDICFLTYGRPNMPYMNRLIVCHFKDKKVTSIYIPKKYSTFRPFTIPEEHAVHMYKEDISYFSSKWESLLEGSLLLDQDT